MKTGREELAAFHELFSASCAFGHAADRIGVRHLTRDSHHFLTERRLKFHARSEGLAYDRGHL